MSYVLKNMILRAISFFSLKLKAIFLWEFVSLHFIIRFVCQHPPPPPSGIFLDIHIN